MILARLREETRDWHDRLERDLDLLRPDVDRGRYTELLARFYGFYAPWEAVVSPVIKAALPELGERSKTPALLRDLESLGLSAATVAALPLRRELPQLAGAAEVLGSQYVLEGATLGGQILLRRFEPLFGSAGGRGCEFFRGYGQETGRMWREFGALVRSHSDAISDVTMVRSARATFAAMHDWLCAARP